MTRGIAIRYSERELDFIQRNRVMPRPQLTDFFNFCFNKTLTVDQVKSLCTRKGWATGRDGCFRPGSLPWNTGTKGLTHGSSTSFKKGRPSLNKKHIGYERIDKDGYTLIKVAEPNVFKFKQRVIYEQHHGPIPKGHVVKFVDENKQNFNIENLVLLTMGENAILNRHMNYNVTGDAKMPVIALTKIRAQIGVLKRASSSRTNQEAS